MVPPEMFAARSESERMAAFLNEQEALHANEIDSHSTALRIEVAGAASMLTGIAAREYRRMAAAAGQPRDAEDANNSWRVGSRITDKIAHGLEKRDKRHAFGNP